VSVATSLHWKICANQVNFRQFSRQGNMVFREKMCANRKAGVAELKYSE